MEAKPMPFKTELLHRVQRLAIKLAGFEGLIWLTATAALFLKCISDDTWVLLSLGASGIKTFQGYQKNKKDLQNITEGDKAP
jgi:hypothetical protein